MYFIDPNGEEKIAVAGAQYEKGSGNKLMFANQAIRSMRIWSEDSPDESRTLVLFTAGYTYEQIKKIQVAVIKTGGKLVRVNSAQEFVNYVNSKDKEDGGDEDGTLTFDRTDDIITDMDIYAHGVVGSIEFGYDPDGTLGAGIAKSYRLDKKVAEKFNAGAFGGTESCVTSYACRTASGNEDIYITRGFFDSDKMKSSLAMKLASSTGARTRGYLVRTSYVGTLGNAMDRRFRTLYPVPRQFKVDGATFAPEGANRPVTPAASPYGVDKNMFEFTLKGKVYPVRAPVNIPKQKK